MLLTNSLLLVCKLAFGIPWLLARRLAGFPRNPRWTVKQDIGAYALQQFLGCLPGLEVRTVMNFVGPRMFLCWWRGTVKTTHVKGDGFEGYWINAAPEPGAKKTIVMLFMHGGGYVFGHAQGYLDAFVKLQRNAQKNGFNLCIFSLEYTLAPEAVYPTQREQAFKAYKYLLATTKLPSNHIYLAGDSAGGNLTTATVLKIRDEKAPTPGGAIMISPWCDFRMEACDAELEKYDMLHLDGMRNMRALFLKGLDISPDDPGISHRHASFHGVCPLMITGGGKEVLISQIRTLAARASEHGVKVQLEIDPEMI
eukprot:Colp12_sorted_trinity150504_noHs@10759